jgi:hypothetical protein
MVVMGWVVQLLPTPTAARLKLRFHVHNLQWCGFSVAPPHPAPPRFPAARVGAVAPPAAAGWAVNRELTLFGPMGLPVPAAAMTAWHSMCDELTDGDLETETGA